MDMESWKDLIAGNILAQKLVKKTLSRYKENRDVGTLAVIQWIVDACSCKCKVQTIESISDLTKQMEKDVFTDHEGFPVLENKKISTKLCHLMELLIKTSEQSILYDGFLMYILCRLLCSLSRSRVRGFRHVSTLAGLSIASELAELCHNLRKEGHNLNKQLNADKDFTVEIEVSRQESLSSSVSELSENLQEANQLMQLLVTQIFQHRIRDVSSKIRIFCCEKLKSWMEEYPDLFLSDENLEIVYTLMHDPVQTIRKDSLKIMESLVLMKETRHIIENFLSRSKARVIAMTLDVSLEVASQAVRVLALIDRVYQSLLSATDKEELFLLVFSKDKQVAQEAATHVLEVSREIMQQDGSHLLEAITCFFMECNLPGHEILLIDSLWNLCKELSDWKEFVECFVRQNDTDTKIAFLRIMVTCIHRAVTGETPRKKGQVMINQPVMTIERSRSKMIEEERKDITEVFMVYLPEIIKQNMKEEIILIEILKIPIYLQTEVYGCTINQKPLEVLLDTLDELAIFTNDDRVLKSIAETYDLFNSPEVATFDTTAVRCGMLMGTIVEATKKAMENFQCVVQESMPPVEVIYETEKWTKKLCYLSQCIDIRSYSILNEILEFIAADIGGSFPVPDEVMRYMLWSYFHGMKMNVEKSTGVDKNSKSFKDMINELQNFIQILTDLLSSNNKSPTQKEAFNIFCNLVSFLHVFCMKYSSLTELLYKPDGHVEDRLLHVLNEWVFILPDQSEESVTKITLDERKEMLRAYWKLLSCRALPIKFAEKLFSHYTVFPEYEDCFQQMLQVLLQFSSELCAEILVQTLLSLFYVLKRSTQPKSLNSLKIMARKFAAVLQENPNECREAVVAVQKKAIYSIRQHENWPQYINFLEVFTDFAQITHVSDVTNLLKYVQQNVPLKEHPDIPEMESLRLYIRCLLTIKESA